MGLYLLKVPVFGVQYYAVRADSAEEAIEIADDAPWDLPEPVNIDVSLDGDFELHDVLEPGEND